MTNIEQIVAPSAYSRQPSDLITDLQVSNDGFTAAFLTDAGNLPSTDSGSNLFKYDVATGSVLFDAVAVDFDLSADGNVLAYTYADSAFVSEVTLDFLNISIVVGNQEVFDLLTTVNDLGAGFSSVLNPSISNDGNLVVFEARYEEPTDLNPEPFRDIYLYNLATEELLLITDPLVGTQADDSSYDPVISADGLWVAFRTAADNLTNDGTGFSDNHVFLYSVTSGSITQRASQIDFSGTSQSIDLVLDVGEPVISDDGERVAFTMALESGLSLVSVYFRTPQELQPISYSVGGSERSGYNVSISGDGTLVGFLSDDSDLVFEDMNFATDAFVANLSEELLVRVSNREDLIESFGTSSEIAVSNDLAFFVSDETDMAQNDPFTQALFGITELVDYTTTAVLLPFTTQPDNDTFYRSFLSGDGQFVSFVSEATNLVPFDRNGLEDLFVVDRGQEGGIDRLNLAQSEEASATLAYGGAMSDDGRFVVFRDYALLSPGASNPFRTDILLVDRESSNFIERISVNDSGLQANASSLNSDISGDGRYVAFDSDASNLLSVSDTNSVSDVFVKDRQTGAVERVNVDSLGQQANGSSTLIAITSDGRHVLFSSLASNLVANDTNNESDLFVHDRQTGLTQRVSVTDGGGQIDTGASVGSISDDGRYVAFQTGAATVVPGDDNDRFDVFVLDRFSNRVERASLDATGQEAPSDSYSPTLSPDGRFLLFISNAPLTDEGLGLFALDRSDDTLTYVGVADGTPPAFSADLSTISFTSAAPLVQGDTNNRSDAYVADFSFGPAAESSIAGFVFVDTNFSEAYDTGEGVEGAIVFIDQNENGQLDVEEPEATTLSDGSYLFSNVDPGLYSLGVISPSGYEPYNSVEQVTVDFGQAAQANFAIAPELRIVTLALDSASIDEGGSPVSLTVMLDQPSVVDISVFLTLRGSATLNEDYEVEATEVMLEAGQTAISIQVYPLADNENDDAETVVFEISSTNFAQAGSPSEVTLTINDVPTLPTVTLSVDPSDIDEGQSSTITATLSAISDIDVGVLLSYSGDADDNDYLATNEIIIPAGELSASINLVSVIDSATESPEEVIVAISEVSGADEDGQQQQSITINDVQIELPDLSAVILSDLVDPLQPQAKTIVTVAVENLGDSATTTGQSVFVVLSSDDTFSEDDIVLGSHPLPGSIAADTSVEIDVNVTAPADVEAGEYFLLAVVDPDDTITESDELNNTDAVPVEVALLFGSGGAGKGGSLNFTDDDGTNTTFKLTGGGTGEIIQDGEFIDLLLNDTTPNSSLKITTKNSGQQGDDGLITIRNIIVNGSSPAQALFAGAGSVAPAADEAATLGKLLAKTTRLIGTLSADSGLKTIDLNEADGAVMNIGATGNPADTLTLKLVQVKNLTINSEMPIKSFSAAQWIDDDETPDQLTAPSLGALKITGNSGLGLAGDFQADVILSNAGAATLSAKISGNLSDVAWNVVGGAKSLSMAGASNAAMVFSGDVGKLTTGAWAGGSFAAATLKSAKTTGDFNANLTLTGDSDSGLGSAKFGGAISGVWTFLGGAGKLTAQTIAGLNLRGIGSIAAITAGSITDSLIFLGVNDDLDTLPQEPEDFVSDTPVLGSLSVNGDGASFARSLVAAPTIGKLTLREVDASDTEFGFAARVVSSFTRTVNGSTEKLSDLDTGDETIREGNFSLRIVDAQMEG